MRRRETRDTMAERGRIQTLFILILEFHFTGASYFIRHGDDVTLTSENMRNDQNNCDRTTWIFSSGQGTSAETLFEKGKIHQNSESKSDRLSVTEKCSLIIKKVTEEDVGRYTCRQFDTSEQQQGSDSVTELSVVNMTERKDADIITLSCSVRTYGGCGLTVKWLFNGRDVENNSPFVKESQSPCNTTIEFVSSLHKYPSENFTCEVTEGNDKHQFNLSRQSPGGTTITATTTKPEPPAPTSTGQGAAQTDSVKPEVWWWLLAVAALVLVALIVVAVRWRRSRGTKTQRKDKTELNLSPTGSPPAAEPSHDMADPEDGVPYASISFTKDSQTKAQAQSRSDDGDDAVTYTTVKASSEDPSSLYASINKPRTPRHVV